MGEHQARKETETGREKRERETSKVNKVCSKWSGTSRRAYILHIPLVCAVGPPLIEHNFCIQNNF